MKIGLDARSTIRNKPTYSKNNKIFISLDACLNFNVETGFCSVYQHLESNNHGNSKRSCINDAKPVSIIFGDLNVHKYTSLF